MIQYLFKMAQAYQLPFATERGWFANDAAALAHVGALATAYPLAATVTVSVAPRLVERVFVNAPPPDHLTETAIAQSWSLIAASRELLKAMADRPAGRA